jgi:hypothetical protein
MDVDEDRIRRLRLQTTRGHLVVSAIASFTREGTSWNVGADRKIVARQSGDERRVAQGQQGDRIAAESSTSAL